MRKHGNLRAPATLLAVLLVLGFSAGLAVAEDLKGKFYIGGGLGVLVTNDNIRNNAALIIAPLGDDGAPFTGDPGEEVSCDSNRADVFCDPRPDDLIARETQIETSFIGDIRFGYGLTSTLSLEFRAGYFEGDLNNLDVYTTKMVPVGSNPLDLCLNSAPDPNQPILGKQACNLNGLRERDIKEPITAGTITQIPLELNAIARFRKDSNFNPYIGGGVGYLIADLEVSDSIDALNERMERLRLQTTTDEFGPNFGKVFSFDGNGNAEFNLPAEVTIEDGFQWQFMGGVDYFFSDRLSLHFEARYVLAKELPWSDADGTHSVKVSFNGEDQINLNGFPEDVFRLNGNNKIFLPGNVAPNPLDPNDPTGVARITCDFDGDGNINNNDFKRDYDGDGLIDQCYTGGQGNPTQTVVVQGGKVDLTNFTFGFGIKFHF